MEGVSEEMLRQIRDVAISSRRAKAGGLLLRPALLEFREVIDPESAGGAYLLGPAAPRRRAPRALQPPRHRPGDPAGRARRCEGDVVGRTHAALEAAARRCARPRLSGSPSTVASP